MVLNRCANLARIVTCRSLLTPVFKSIRDAAPSAGRCPSTLHDVRGLDAACGVARVHYQLRFGNDAGNSAQKSITLQRFEVGAEKINVNSFKLSPTSMGESDIIKNVLLIPGVQSVGEGSAGFNVRGGSADQNLILLYGAPVYNSSHFFGFFSAVNSDIIKDVTLYKGGIPSRYGGRISSVLDIGTKEGNRNEFVGSAGISPITAHVSVEGPIIKDTLTYILTARTTYSNWIFGMINNPEIHNSRASIDDLTA